jgi:mRNA interferase RelE/StbE
MFDYRFINESRKQYRNLDEPTKQRVNEALNDIMESPFRNPHISKLKGRQDEYRYKLGDYRIVYHTDKQERMCTILAIVSREGAY